MSDIEERIAKLERAMSRALDREARRECYSNPDAEPVRMAPATRGLVHGSGKVPANLKPPAKAANVKRDSDPEPPATWRAGFGTPPDGTIVAADHLAPWMLEEGRWRCSTGSRSVSCDVNQLTRPCHVLRWGWTK